MNYQKTKEKLNTADIIFYTDVQYRFAIHLIKTIENRLNKAFDKFLTIITNELIDFDAFSLELLTLKKELDYIFRIINIKIVPDICKKDIVAIYQNVINAYYELIEDILKKHYQDNYLTEYQNILNKEGVNHELPKN